MKKILSKIYGVTFKPIVFSIIFLVTLFSYIGVRLVEWQVKKLPYPEKIRERILSRAYKLYDLIARMNRHRQGTISRVNLMELAFRNMSSKKSRTFITIGGMAVGIGAIVFLVSLGYGIQELVISRVARLDEMKQVNVSPQPGSQVKINDETIARLADIEEVEESLPLISVVGSVNYQNSVSDMAVYGVTSAYLRHSAITPVQGDIFDSNDLTIQWPKEDQQKVGSILKEDEVKVAAVTTEDVEFFEIGQEIARIGFSINPRVWLKVRNGPNVDAEVIGYTKRMVGRYEGELVVGSVHEKKDEEDGENEEKSDEKEEGSGDEKKGEWIKARIYIWEKKECDEKTNMDCIDGKFVVRRDENSGRIQEEGYIARTEMSMDILEDYTKEGPKVLGVEVDAETIDASELGIEGLDIGETEKENIKEVSIDHLAKKEAVVNRAMLSILNINEEEAVGESFDVSFEAVGNLLEDSSEKVKSTVTNYRIVGVTPDDKVPVFYVPFVDLRAVGIVNYSQLKVITKGKEFLSDARKKIEAMGYSTDSVVDTVNQINSLFQTARVVLALIGTVALAVASLGMFNTLTVSLLERTREVGLMKSMGMKSYEVKEMFLVESLLMGFFGGVVGLLLGFLAGKGVGVVLSMFSLFKGVGTVDIAHIPSVFVAVIVFLSLFVGVVTGIYPAQRAKKISALNALRYE